MPWTAIAELLDAYGAELSGEVATDAAAAVRAARRQGFPVVAKVSAPDGSHKTEGGLVRVGIGDEVQLGELVSEWSQRLGPVEVVVQPMASGVEIAVGLVRDPVVGPLVMVAAGGVDIDVWNDRAFLLAPSTAADVRRALQGLRVWPLLTGHRGSSAVDVEALVDLVVAIGRLGDEVPEVQELDLNPVMVSATGCALVDARLRLGAPTRRRGEAPELG
jgi:acyl-CoA synthetase (NDP forming)